MPPGRMFLRKGPLPRRRASPPVVAATTAWRARPPWRRADPPETVGLTGGLTGGLSWRTSASSGTDTLALPSFPGTRGQRFRRASLLALAGVIFSASASSA